MLKAVFVSAALAAMVAFTAPAAAQSGVFDFDIADFGTRLPMQCGPYSDALEGGPTGEEAAIMYRCREEADNLRYDQRLHMWEDVSFNALGERAATTNEMMMLGYVHGTPIYAFEGTATQVICSRISSATQNAGRNCDEFPLAGRGICFFTASNIWQCDWNGFANGTDRYGVAPR